MSIFFGEYYEKLVEVTDSWIGVPYQHMGVSRGGVDCTKLIALVLVEMGILSKIEKSYYGLDWYLHGDAEILLTAFYQHLVKYLVHPFDCVIFKYRKGIELWDGDIICFSTNTKGICNHSGMYIEGKLFHTIQGVNTVKTWFSEHWSSKAKFIFRLKLK